MSSPKRRRKSPCFRLAQSPCRTDSRCRWNDPDQKCYYRTDSRELFEALAHETNIYDYNTFMALVAPYISLSEMMNWGISDESIMGTLTQYLDNPERFYNLVVEFLATSGSERVYEFIDRFLQAYVVEERRQNLIIKALFTEEQDLKRVRAQRKLVLSLTETEAYQIPEEIVQVLLPFVRENRLEELAYMVQRFVQLADLNVLEVVDIAELLVRLDPSYTPAVIVILQPILPIFANERIYRREEREAVFNLLEQIKRSDIERRYQRLIVNTQLQFLGSDDPDQLLQVLQEGADNLAETRFGSPEGLFVSTVGENTIQLDLFLFQRGLNIRTLIEALQSFDGDVRAFYITQTILKLERLGARQYIEEILANFPEYMGGR